MIELSNCKAVMLDKDDKFYGWLFYKHPDGQWVSLRKLTNCQLLELEIKHGHKA